MNYSPSDVEMFCGFVMCVTMVYTERESNVNTKASTARTLGHEGNQQENMERMR